MRYTEKIRKREFETPFDYLRGILEAILLAPYRLTREISLKLPYLPAKKVEIFFTISFLIGAVVTAVNFLLQYRKGVSSLWYSRLPMVVPLVGLVLLAVLLFVVSGVCRKQDAALRMVKKAEPRRDTRAEETPVVQEVQAVSPDWESMLDTGAEPDGLKEGGGAEASGEGNVAMEVTKSEIPSIVGEDEAALADEFNLMFSPDVLEGYDIYEDLDLSV